MLRLVIIFLSSNEISHFSMCLAIALNCFLCLVTLNSIFLHEFLAELYNKTIVAVYFDRYKDLATLEVQYIVIGLVNCTSLVAKSSY